MATDEAAGPVTIRTVRHKTTAAALLAAGCSLGGLVRSDDNWCEIEVLVPPELSDVARKIATDGEGVMIDWGTYREHLRELSKLIKGEIEEERR